MTIPDLTLDQATEELPVASDGVEALRYLASSVIALGVDSMVLALGVRYSDLPIWISGAVAYFAGLLVIYLLSIHWVFTRRAMQRAPGEFVVFALLGIVGLMLNSATLYLATAAGLGVPLAKVASAGIGFVANYVSRKFILFSKRS